MSAAAAAIVTAVISVINPAERMTIDQTLWTVYNLWSKYELPTEEHPEGTGRLYLTHLQRLWSWRNKDGLKRMRNFIDSVLHNYPIPTIILTDADDGVRSRWEIYDGRHRVETLWRFVNDRFSIILDDGREVHYSDMSAADKALFNERQIPVVIVRNATPTQLGQVFIRLNSGKTLTHADKCWACRETPFIADTMAILAANKERFSGLFGGADITHRKRLPDWVGLFAGIVTGDAANMTTSFERIESTTIAEGGPLLLDTHLPAAAATEALDALDCLYRHANTVAIVSPGELKPYQKLGFINAFFFDTWLTADNKGKAITNWVAVIKHIRTTFNREIITVSGAQNLNHAKLAIVREKVRIWLETGHTPVATHDAASEDTDEDDE